MSEDAEGRRPSPRGRPVPLAAALVMAVAALAIGLVLGWAARGGPEAAPLVTVERTVPVVTVTAPEDAPP